MNESQIAYIEHGWGPYGWLETDTGERAYDNFSRLLRERIIFLNGPVMNGILRHRCHSFCTSRQRTRPKNLYVYQ